MVLPTIHVGQQATKHHLIVFQVCPMQAASEQLLPFLNSQILIGLDWIGLWYHDIETRHYVCIPVGV